MSKLIPFTGSVNDENSLNIQVKSNTGSTISVHLDLKLNIKNVKEIVAPKLGLSPENIKIIFAGKELSDSTTIEDCDLGEQSILHAVKITTNLKNVSSHMPCYETVEETQTIETKTDANEERNDENAFFENMKPHFHVYCSGPCKKINPGKLRVRCADCKYGAFTVDGDLQSWTDVLIPKRMTGVCNNTNCSGKHAEFYFKCASHPSQGESDVAVPLNLIRRNHKEVPCLACTDVSDPVLVFSCDVGHVICLECFKSYCISRLRDRQFFSHPDFGYTLSCPVGCENSFIEEVHHFRLLTESQYQQYHKFATEEFILQAGGVLCPQPGCGEGILVDKDCNRVQCSIGCGYVFCAKCLEGYHIGDCLNQANLAESSKTCDYNLDPDKVQRARWDEASTTVIKVLTKPCPKCRTSTERAGGCMHMVCTRANCGYHWCWVCQGPWGRECMASHWFG